MREMSAPGVVGKKGERAGRGARRRDGRGGEEVEEEKEEGEGRERGRERGREARLFEAGGFARRRDTQQFAARSSKNVIT